jgi:hypothetical protein
MNYTLYLVHLLAHQFGVLIRGGFKAMVHGIRVVLNVHPNSVVLQVDVENTFNSISHKAMF